MSIAAVSPSPVSATLRALAVSSPGPAAASPQAPVPDPAVIGGRRHQLVDAIDQVLGLDPAQSSAATQPVLSFAHAMMQDLRGVNAASAGAAGQGLAWGRSGWNDLAQRIAALATAVSGAAAAPAGPTPADAAAATTSVIAAAQAAAQAALPQLSKPVTSISTGVALMRVPSSRLIEAYAAMRAALGQEPPAAASDVPANDLAGFLDQLSHQLAPATSSAPLPSGAVLSVTA